jgi:subfamily B ATP-binding cassette protein MsbA
MNYYLRLLKFFRPYGVQILGVFTCTLLITGATLLVAPLAGLAFKAIEGKNLLLLNLSALGVILLYLIKGVFTYGQDYLSYFVSSRVMVDLRLKTYEHLQSHSLDFYTRWNSGELISRIMNDISTLQSTLLLSLTGLVPHSLLLLGLLLYIFWLNWRLSLLTLIALPLIIQVIRIFGAEIRSLSEKVQQKMADLTTHLSETFSQIKIIKAYTMEEAEIKRFEEKNYLSLKAVMGTVRLLSTQNPAVALLQAVTAVAIVWYGGLEIIRGNLTLPQLISFATALGIMTDPGSTLSKAFATIQQGSASAKRIFEILETHPSIKEDPEAVELPPLKGKVEFRNVSFAYEKEEVLKDINLKVSPGEVIALVGRTGAGKTTLVNLLFRFYDPTKGEILIDDYSLAKVKISSLRKQFALVPQEITLFEGTVRENIAYGTPEASEEEIVAAAAQAHAHEFILKLPQGYNTKVGEKGAILSGGERQRIAIARAILRNPKILVLDEATSALDPENERLIRDALDKLMQGRTTFIIAHRLYTVEKANRIVVLDQGRIVEVGAHPELLAKNGLYKHLYQLQFQNNQL